MGYSETPFRSLLFLHSTFVWSPWSLPYLLSRRLLPPISPFILAGRLRCLFACCVQENAKVVEHLAEPARQQALRAQFESLDVDAKLVNATLFIVVSFPLSVLLCYRGVVLKYSVLIRPV